MILDNGGEPVWFHPTRLTACGSRRSCPREARTTASAASSGPAGRGIALGSHRTRRARTPPPALRELERRHRGRVPRVPFRRRTWAPEKGANAAEKRLRDTADRSPLRLRRSMTASIGWSSQSVCEPRPPCPPPRRMHLSDPGSPEGAERNGRRRQARVDREAVEVAGAATSVTSSAAPAGTVHWP